MHTISRFFTVLIIMMVLIPSTIAAPNENANPKAGLKIVDQSKGTMKEIKDDKVKGVKSSSGDIVVDDKGKNSIKLKDSKPSKVPNEHKKVKVLIPASELQKIDVDNDGVFGVLEIADDGTVIGQRTATTAQLAAGVNFTFSEVEINGFSGYREETFNNVKSGDILDIDDATGDYVLTISADGTIPASAPGIPETGLWGQYELDEGTGTNLIDSSGGGHNLTAVDMTWGTGPDGTPCLNTTTGKISLSTFPNVYNITFYAEYLPANIATNKRLFTLASSSTHYKASVYSNTAGKSSAHAENATGANKYAADTIGHLGAWTNHASTYNNTSVALYQSGSLIAKTAMVSTMALTYDSSISWIANGAGTSLSKFNGSINKFYLYTDVLTPSELSQCYTGLSGISVRLTSDYNFTAYDTATGVEKTVDHAGNCTGIEYIDTTGATRNITTKIYFTEDTSVTTSTEDEDFYNVSISYNVANNATNGTIIKLIPPLYAGTAVLDSNNTNATIAQNRTHFTISTGTLTTADWFGYNVSIPNDADHLMWLDVLLKWVSGKGWDFVNPAPADYSKDISDVVTVTVTVS